MPSFLSFHRLFAMILGTLARLGILIIAGTMGLAPTAEAAEKTANLAKYCRQVHGRTAFPTVDRRDDGLMCSRRTHRGRGLLHRKITAAEVCSAQHRTRRFRRKGKGLICITGGGSASATKSIDLKKHCRTRYGAAAFVTRRRSDNRAMCTIRTNRGRGLRHHLINLASLCGGGSPRVKGDTLYCRRATAGSGRGDGSPGQSSTAPANRGPLPTPRRKGGGKLTKADFRGCSVDADIRKRKVSMPGIMVRPVEGFIYGAVPTPCPGLVGGKVVDLAKYCREFLNWNLGLVFLGGQVPTCGGAPGTVSVLPYHKESMERAYPPVPLIQPCAWAGGITPKNWREFRIVFKYAKRRLECFFFKKAQFAAAWKSGKPKSRTPKKGKVATKPGKKKRDVLGMKLRDEISALEKQEAELTKKVTAQEMELVRIENTFLNSKDGNEAKGMIADARKLTIMDIRDAEKKYHKFLEEFRKQKDASTPEKQACCVYTPQDKINAQNELTSALRRIHRRFEKFRKEVFEDALRKSDPKKFGEYKKALFELNKAKAAHDLVAKKLAVARQKEDKMPWEDDN